MIKNLVSIIVPIYNVEKYLQRCIDSLCNQTYTNLEIILINDGSTDNSVQICESAAKADKRIKILHQKNGGSSIARNNGMDYATGEFISFIDSDDHIEKETIGDILNLLLQNNLDVVEFERDDPSEKKLFDNRFNIETKEQAIMRTIKTSSFQVWKRIYRTSLISDMRFIPKIIHQDVFFVVDLLNRVDKIGYLNKPLYNYNRENISVIRSKYTLVKTKAGINATEYIKKNIPDTPKITEVKKRYIVNYYTGHFFSLCRNKDLDMDKKFRRKLRLSILKNVSLKNIGLRSLITILFPIIISEALVKLHMGITGTKYYN